MGQRGGAPGAWAGWALVLGAWAALLSGCATGAPIDPRGGDGGGGGGTRDSGPADSGSAGGLDAAADDDDAGSGALDGGPSDAGGADAGRLDAGTGDAGCAAGSSMSCTTSCGTSGTSTCVSGGWSTCAPPLETCNGADDDCDSGIDEGSRATVVRIGYDADLATRHAPCDGETERTGPNCAAAIHRYCGARGCTTSGFGPDESAGDGLDVTCVVAEVRSTTFTTLASYHPGCIASAGWGPDCNAAIHRYCGAQGFASGWGPVEQSSGSATVACVRSGAAEVVETSYTLLRTHHDGCDGSTQRIGSECNAAIHRLCRARGLASGFGPVENSGDTAYVACVRN